MKTAAEFQARLQELQSEQVMLLASNDRRKKAVRTRIQEITREFFAVKEEWREALGEDIAGV